MAFPSCYLIHRCIISHRIATSEQDSYGNPIYTEESVEYRCRFAHAGSLPGLGGIVYVARCTVDSSCAVHLDDKLVSTAEGFASEYWVNSVIPILEPLSGRISHLQLELRETEHREAYPP